VLEGALEPERIENAGAIRADLDASSNLPEILRLLIDVDVDPVPEERERNREAANAAADDGDLKQ